MIRSRAEGAAGVEGGGRRTVGFFRVVPAAALDGAPTAGEVTCGDIVRHVVAREGMFAGAAAEGRWRSRSPLASYGTLMGIEAPDIVGLGVEEVARLTAEGAGRQA